MGVAVILYMWPRPREQNIDHPCQRRRNIKYVFNQSSGLKDVWIYWNSINLNIEQVMTFTFSRKISSYSLLFYHIYQILWLYLNKSQEGPSTRCYIQNFKVTGLLILVKKIFNVISIYGHVNRLGHVNKEPPGQSFVPMTKGLSIGAIASFGQVSSKMKMLVAVHGRQSLYDLEQNKKKTFSWSSATLYLQLVI